MVKPFVRLLLKPVLKSISLKTVPSPIAATTQEAGDAAKKRIEEITAEVEVGKVYEGTVVKILDNNVGAMSA